MNFKSTCASNPILFTWKSHASEISTEMKSHTGLSLFCLSCQRTLKPGLHCAVYFAFTTHIMCWKYFDKCFMDKTLLHISLIKLIN